MLWPGSLPRPHHGRSPLSVAYLLKNGASLCDKGRVVLLGGALARWQSGGTSHPPPPSPPGCRRRVKRFTGSRKERSQVPVTRIVLLGIIMGDGKTPSLCSNMKGMGSPCSGLSGGTCGALAPHFLSRRLPTNSGSRSLALRLLRPLKRALCAPCRARTMLCAPMMGKTSGNHKWTTENETLEVRTRRWSVRHHRGSGHTDTRVRMRLVPPFPSDAASPHTRIFPNFQCA